MLGLDDDEESRAPEAETSDAAEMAGAQPDAGEEDDLPDLLGGDDDDAEESRAPEAPDAAEVADAQPDAREEAELEDDAPEDAPGSSGGASRPRRRGGKNKKKNKKGAGGQEPSTSVAEPPPPQLTGLEMMRHDIARLTQIMASDPEWIAFSPGEAKWQPFSAQQAKIFRECAACCTSSQSSLAWVMRAESTLHDWIIRKVPA
jgi:hypothetical protein